VNGPEELPDYLGLLFFKISFKLSMLFADPVAAGERLAWVFEVRRAAESVPRVLNTAWPEPLNEIKKLALCEHFLKVRLDGSAAGVGHYNKAK